MGLTQTGTDGIKDDAITLAKQAAGTDGQIITYDASGNPVAVGPGTDGQVLTSTGAGSPPAFESISIPAGTTINNNADNRVITGSGTANTLEGDANLTFDGSALKATTSSGLASISIGSGDASGANLVFDGDSNGDFAGNDYSSIQHTSDGNLIIKANSPGTANCYIALGSDGDYGAHFNEGGSSLLRYDNSTKIETIATGINVTGGIRLGGNNTANEMQDYEEGTWTPNPLFESNEAGETALTGSGGLFGRYTKIGNLVYCHFSVNFTGRSGTASGVFYIGGLPFAISAANWNEDGGTVHYYTGITTPASPPTIMCVSTNKIKMAQAGTAIRDNAVTDWNDQWSANEVGTGDIRIRGSFTYHTAA